MSPHTPNPEPPVWMPTETTDSTFLEIDEPGDTTVRPRRPEVPLPGEEPRPVPRQANKPDTPPAT